MPTVLVAGTNGKGSTAALVASATRAAGYRVGLFTSPSLGDAREQVEVDGEPLPPDAYARLESSVARAAERAGVDPSPFETLTAVAFLAFAGEETGEPSRRPVDLAVVEAGLGGARDATNVADPRASAIVSVGLDHREHLGDTLAEIARDKAGVFRKDRPAVIGWLDDEALDAALGHAEAIGARVDRASERGAWTGELGLAGAHQRRNARVAVSLLEHLRADGFDRLDDAAIERGLASCRWPGRLEWIDVVGRRVLLDAAHNVEGARALGEYLDAELPGETRPDLLFGAYRDKDAAGMLQALRPRVARVWLAPLDSQRSWDPAPHAREQERVAPDVSSALAEALAEPEATEQRRPLLVAGSVFLVGSVRQSLTRPVLAAGG